MIKNRLIIPSGTEFLVSAWTDNYGATAWQRQKDAAKFFGVPIEHVIIERKETANAMV